MTSFAPFQSQPSHEMQDKAEDYARRAAEEFIAAGRAVTPEDRAAHRASALAYVALRDRPSRYRIGR